MRLKTISIAFALFSFLFILMPAAAYCEVAGRLTSVTGGVDITRADGKKGALGVIPAEPVKPGDEVSVGDILRTRSDGAFELTMIDDSVMKVGAKSRLGIEKYMFDSKTEKRNASVRLYRGKAWFMVRKVASSVHKAIGAEDANNKYEFKTRTAVCGIRGTRGILFSDGIERVYIEEGLVEFYNGLGKVMVGSGRVGEISFGKAPVVRPFTESEYKKHEERLDKRGHGATGARSGSDDSFAGTDSKTDSTSASGVNKVSDVNKVAERSEASTASVTKAEPIESIETASPVLNASSGAVVTSGAEAGSNEKSSVTTNGGANNAEGGDTKGDSLTKAASTGSTGVSTDGDSLTKAASTGSTGASTDGAKVTSRSGGGDDTARAASTSTAAGTPTTTTTVTTTVPSTITTMTPVTIQQSSEHSTESVIQGTTQTTIPVTDVSNKTRVKVNVRFPNN